jgi:Holliday junction resolvase RusA-like endonuclease
MPEIRFPVRDAMPVPWGNKEWDWRSAVAKEARKHREKVEANPVSGETRFEVDIIFHLTAQAAKRHDVDNLAKPVLDTVFKSRRCQAPGPSLTGALFGVDDDRVFRLTLEKREADQPQDIGIDFAVRW